MADTKFKSGASGNPRGRPRRKTLLEMIGATGMADIVAAMKKAALEGDVQAAKLLVPPLKAELPRANIPELTEAKTHTQKVDAIMAAAGRGDISPDVAQALTGALANAVKVTELDELARRIQALENKRESA